MVEKIGAEQVIAACSPDGLLRSWHGLWWIRGGVAGEDEYMVIGGKQLRAPL